MPDFLLEGVNLYEDNSPEYNVEDLMLAFGQFIAELGKQYDGDPRILMIEAGLYGEWGEWHTFSESERAMTQENKDRLLITYQDRFLFI